MNRLLNVLIILLALSLSLHAAEVKIGIAWEGKSGMTTRVAAGLKKVLNKEAPEIKIEWQQELRDIRELDTAARLFSETRDAMVLLRSSGAVYLKHNKPKIPAFIGGCNDPKELGVISNLEKPEGLITGVTYALPHKMKFNAFKEVLPKMKSILLLVEKDHPGSFVDRQGTMAACDSLKIKYSDRVCASRFDLIKAVKINRKKVSAIIIGNQALLMDNAPEIVRAAGDTPVISYNAKPVKGGVLCGLSADDEKLGEMLARSIIDVMVKKKAIRDVPVKVDPEPTLHINAKTAKRLGIKVPSKVLKKAAVTK